MGEESRPSASPGPGQKVRAVTAWIAVFGGMFFAAGYLISAAYRGLTTEILQKLVTDHYLGVIGMPIMAIFSLVIVVILRVTEGEIEIGTPFGFNFKGASGPIILWIFCFLAMVFGAQYLW